SVVATVGGGYAIVPGAVAATAFCAESTSFLVGKAKKTSERLSDSVEELLDKDEKNSTKVTSNLGNEIDITPSSNHTAVSKNPGPKGVPNSSVDILDDAGNVSTRRWYDSNGNAYRDVDMTNHGNPKTHPEYPHEHIWDWSSGNPQRGK
ncbi:MAG: hypothetical protein IJZ25_02785, partial [Lachnospiraceae bacterium]|nr:hypothetical protein [Lachnospiraceae bacterium]